MSLILGSAPAEKAGSAASINETSGEFGVALGVAAFGSLGTLVYRTQLADHLPNNLPNQAADSARESIAGAANAATQLPATLGAELLDAARTAFTTGLNTVAAIGAVIFIALAITAATTLRHSAQTTQPAADTADHPTTHTDPIPADAQPSPQP